MGNIFFIADTHFGHSNIIRYENRPFGSVGQMDAYLAEQWNATVSEEDTVYVVGDFSFYSKGKTREICSRLCGHKYLIIGNHDRETPKDYLDAGFDWVYDKPVVLDGFWLVSHEPLYINPNMPYANIFGHVHANPAYSDYSPQSFCVSVERISYRPVAFDEIKRKMGLSQQQGDGQ